MFRVENWKAIDKKLKKLEKRTAKKVVTKELRNTAKVFQKESKTLAPVEKGDLKKSIKVKAMKRKKGRIGVNAIISEGDFKGDQYYGSFQEFGWKPGKRGSDQRGEMTTPKAFMDSGWKRHASEQRIDLPQRIFAAIENEMRKK
jgi:HK97 gp10 family phage protein